MPNAFKLEAVQTGGFKLPDGVSAEPRANRDKFWDVETRMSPDVKQVCDAERDDVTLCTIAAGIECVENTVTPEDETTNDGAIARALQQLERELHTKDNREDHNKLGLFVRIVKSVVMGRQ